MKQFVKALFVLGVLVTASVVTFTISQAQTVVTADLALEQFADPSTVTDTTIRTLPNAILNTNLIIWAVAIGISLLTYYSEIKNGIVYLFTRNEDIEDAEVYGSDV